MSKVAEAPTEVNVQFLPISKLEAHPKNPHGVLKKGDPAVQDLAAKIRAVGQKVPNLVRPKGDGWQIVLGHRRTFVRELLGFSDAPCIVEDMTDEMADVLVVQENDSHEPPNAFLEAEVVSDLLGRPGWTLESVALNLGRSKRWVALRSNLRNLSPKIRERLAKKKTDWPLEWLEDVARLTKDAQERLLAPAKGYYRPDLADVRSRGELDRLLADEFHELGKAPWDLADGTLVPKAGPCATCPKTSLASPGLFDDAETDPQDPKALKKAICRDSLCWQAKKDAVTKSKIVELREKEPKAEVLREYHAHVPAGIKAREKGYGVQVVKKETKGAKPAILLTEKDEPELAYVKERTYGSKPKADPAKKPAKDEDPKKALARSRKEIESRREELFYTKIGGAIADRKEAPPHEVVLGLVAAFSVDEDWESDQQLESVKKAFDLAAKLEKWDEKVWDRMKHLLERPLEDPKKREAYAEWITAVLEIDVEKLRAEVLCDVPDPKWWPKEAVANFMADAVKPGVCRGCGCTHLRACPQGCSWVDLPDEHGVKKKVDGVFLARGLCSSCSGTQPAGKAKKKRAKAKA